MVTGTFVGCGDESETISTYPESDFQNNGRKMTNRDTDSPGAIASWENNVVESSANLPSPAVSPKHTVYLV